MASSVRLAPRRSTSALIAKRSQAVTMVLSPRISTGRLAPAFFVEDVFTAVNLPKLALKVKPEVATNGTTKQEVAGRLNEAVRRGGGLAEVAKRARLPTRTLSNYLSGANEMKIPALVALARACGVSIEWLATGIESPVSAHAHVELPVGMTLIPRLGFRPSAGGGSVVVQGERTSLAFPVGILDALRVRPESARVMEASGSSMSPTIEDGDLMIVDVSPERIENPADGLIYVFSVGDAVFVKRLRRAPGGLMMRSDNIELFPNEERIPPEVPFRIYGRVRWVGGLV